MADQTTQSEWIVVIGSGSWTAKCYGTFESYDAAIAWVKRNQFEAEEAQVYPVNWVDSERAEETR